MWKKAFTIAPALSVLIPAQLSAQPGALQFTDTSYACRGNIAPYRHEILKRVAEKWHPLRTNDHVELEMTIAKNGRVKDVELIETNEGQKRSKAFHDTLASTKFAPLPDWFQGSSLIFKFHLNASDFQPQRQPSSAKAKALLQFASSRPSLSTKRTASDGDAKRSQNTNVITAAPRTIPKTLAARDNDFGINLFQQNMAARSARDNVLISPVSIAMALQMVTNGATDDTKKEMMSALRASDGTPADFNAANHLYLEHLAKRGASPILQIANGMFVNKDYKVAPQFSSALSEFYHAPATQVDFASPSSVRTINSWVNEKTQHKITGILDQPQPSTKMMLVNAVYFKGRWLTPFRKELTEPLVFHGASGDHPVKMMKQFRFEANFVEDADMQAILLPYENDQNSREANMRMVIILPRAGKFATIQSRFTPEWFEAVTASCHSGKGQLFLPRFKLEFSEEQTKPLESLGIKRVFTDKAQLTNCEATHKPMKVSTVLHKTLMEVNEEGTVAAAVTGIGMVACPSVEVVPHFNIVVDHPFFIALQDDRGTLLFLGRVNDVKE